MQIVSGSDSQSHIPNWNGHVLIVLVVNRMEICLMSHTSFRICTKQCQRDFKARWQCRNWDGRRFYGVLHCSFQGGCHYSGWLATLRHVPWKLCNYRVHFHLSVWAVIVHKDMVKQMIGDSKIKHEYNIGGDFRGYSALISESWELLKLLTTTICLT